MKNFSNCFYLYFIILNIFFINNDSIMINYSLIKYLTFLNYLYIYFAQPYPRFFFDYFNHRYTNLNNWNYKGFILH